MTIRAVFAVAVVAGMGAGGCAHAHVQDDDVASKPAANGGTRVTWIDQLPLCDADATAASIDISALTPETAGTVVTARGLLTLSANRAACTLKGCPSTSRCCNGCSVPWIVVPSRKPAAGEPPGREFMFMGSDGKSPPSMGVADCALDAMIAQAPRVEVVITGTPQGTWLDMIADAAICRVAPAPG